MSYSIASLIKSDKEHFNSNNYTRKSISPHHSIQLYPISSVICDREHQININVIFAENPITHLLTFLSLNKQSTYLSARQGQFNSHILSILPNRNYSCKFPKQLIGTEKNVPFNCLICLKRLFVVNKTDFLIREMKLTFVNYGSFNNA